MSGNKRLRSLIFFSLFILLFMTNNALAADGADLKVSILKYEPVPAEIGEYVTVWIKIENQGYAKTEDLSLQIVPDYPFSIDSAENAVVSIGILSPGNAAVEDFRLYTDPSAKQGTSTIEVWYQEDTGGTWVKKEFELKVGSDTFDSRGNIELVEDPVQEPDVFMPGDSGTISFTLRNSATDYSVTIDGEQYDTNARIQSATLSGVDGIRVTTDTYYGNGVIGPGESVDLTYNIEVDNNTSDGTYYLDLSIVGSSHSYNNNWRIPVKVDSSSVRVIPSKPLTLQNGAGTLEFDVANIHPNALSSVSVKLDADGIDFSPSEYFIGSMDADELFTIQVAAKATKQDISFPVNLTVHADYRNGLNEHTELIAVRQLDQTVVEEGAGAGTYAVIILLLAIAGGGYVFYRRRSQKE